MVFQANDVQREILFVYGWLKGKRAKVWEEVQRPMFFSTMGGMTRAASKLMTAEEYLEVEAASELRHEFVDGAPVAMAGSSLTHNEIIFNIRVALIQKVREKACDRYRSSKSHDETRALSLPRYRRRLRR